MCAAWIHLSRPHRVDSRECANVPFGFAWHVSRAEEDLSVPKKALLFSRAWPSVGYELDAQQ